MRTIRSIAREIIGFVLRLSGANWVIRNVFCRKKATILVYHDPDPEVFKKHMQYLSKRYEFITLERLVSAIEKGKPSDIPPKALVVTLDDGHKSNYELLPIMKEFNVKPTIYVCSDIIGTNRRFWWSKVPKTSIRNFKRLPADVALEKLRQETGYDTTKEYPQRQALAETEVLDMQPHVDFGSHTRFHPILPQCENERCMDEIMDSKESLERLLDGRVEHFAYPCGDYSKREIEYLKRCGYRSARTIDIGWNDVNSDPHRLKAIGIDDNASINVLCGQITGLFSYLKYMWHGSFMGIRPRFL